MVYGPKNKKIYFIIYKVSFEPAVVAEWSNVQHNSCQVLYGMR